MAGSQSARASYAATDSSPAPVPGLPYLAHAPQAGKRSNHHHRQQTHLITAVAGGQPSGHGARRQQLLHSELADVGQQAVVARQVAKQKHHQADLAHQLRQEQGRRARWEAGGWAGSPVKYQCALDGAATATVT